ncbi:MAG: hypothetical protein KGZ42_13915 [Melioribacter sp.]|nr:hypothetical protein [Melioribacter sp.]
MKNFTFILMLLMIFTAANISGSIASGCFGCESISFQEKSQRQLIYDEVDKFIQEGKFKETVDKFRTIKQMNWEDFYCWSVLLTINHQYDDALDILGYFLENINERINKSYVELRWWDNMILFAKKLPLYTHHINYAWDDSDEMTKALVKKNVGLDLTIWILGKETNIPVERLKNLQLPKAPFPGDGIILKAYLCELLGRPKGAKASLLSNKITEDFKLYSEYPTFKWEENDKANIIKTLNEYHRNDKNYIECIANLDKVISAVDNSPKRKKALDEITSAEQYYNNKEFVSAIVRYNNAVQIDSLVLYEESVKDYIELAESKIPELKIEERYDAVKVLEIANKFLAKNKFEETLFCLNRIFSAGIPMPPGQMIDLWNSTGKAYKGLGLNDDAEKAFQKAREIEQKSREQNQNKEPRKVRGR